MEDVAGLGGLDRVDRQYRREPEWPKRVHEEHGPEKILPGLEPALPLTCYITWHGRSYGRWLIVAIISYYDLL